MVIMRYKFHMYPELQIRGGIEDNSQIIFLISQKICCDPHQNCLAETVLMMGRNICFK